MRLLTSSLVSRMHVPSGHFFFDVRLLAPDPDKIGLRLTRVAMIALPLGRVDSENESDKLQDANQARDSEDEAPHLAMAQEISQQLGGEDSHVRHDLGEGAEEALLPRRGDFRDVNGYHDNRNASAQTRDKSSNRHDADVGRESFGDGAEGQK